MQTKHLLAAILIFSFAFLSLSKGYSQAVGINTTSPNPASLLHIEAGTSITKGLLVTGSNNSLSTVPNLGTGSRLMFYPGKGAFRAGYVTGTAWDNANVGFYSTAMGYNTTATSFYSTAMGKSTTATSQSSTAMGEATTAGGYSSTAMGDNTTASGNDSTAMGAYTTAGGFVSTAMGSNTNAGGDFTTAMGTKVYTGHKGTFIIGDSDPNNEGFTNSGTPDQFIARYWNGYYLLTSGDNIRFGVQIAHNGNSWVSISDKNRKENFEQVDGEDILQKISNIEFGSWNYKQQDPKVYRHYGIMAQDFYNAFGHDKYGTIGNDTTVNPIDMIGIDMAAIQALEKRTVELIKENALLNKKVAAVDELKKENESLKQSVAKLQTQFDEQKKLIAQSMDQLKTLALKQADPEKVTVK